MIKKTKGSYFISTTKYSYRICPNKQFSFFNLNKTSVESKDLIFISKRWGYVFNFMLFYMFFICKILILNNYFVLYGMYLISFCDKFVKGIR